MDLRELFKYISRVLFYKFYIFIDCKVNTLFL